MYKTDIQGTQKIPFIELYPPFRQKFAHEFEDPTVQNIFPKIN